MPLTFIHTADLQLGKPFHKVADADKRSLLKEKRFSVIDAIAGAVRENNAAFVLIAGDMFDSPQPTRAVLLTALAKIGGIGVPVYVIPGNHDHGGAGSLWEQEYFLKIRDEYAPNLHVMLSAEAVDIGEALILPCPLLKRQTFHDSTEWLRKFPYAGEKPRIVLAHGSVQEFIEAGDGDDNASAQPNYINLSMLPIHELDYVALGDWHGTQQVNEKTWYAGTPETDRYPRNEEHNLGNILLVNVSRGEVPEVKKMRSTQVDWLCMEHVFSDEAQLAALAERVRSIGGNKVNAHLIKLHLSGRLSLNDLKALEAHIEDWSVACIDLRVDNQVSVIPSEQEIESLTKRSESPLISSVASALLSKMQTEDENERKVVETALKELYFMVSKNN